MRRKYDFKNLCVDGFDETALNGAGVSFWGSTLPIPVLVFLGIYFLGSFGFFGIIILVLIINAIRKASKRNSLREKSYRYYSLMKTRTSWNVEEVAYFMNMPVNRVREDLQYLFDCGAIRLRPESIIYTSNYQSRQNPQRAYDPNKMYSNASYTVNNGNQNYKSMQKSANGLSSYVIPGSYNNNLEMNAVKTPEKNPESELNGEAAVYIRKIRAANDAIPGEVMSEKLDKLENVTVNIYKAATENEEFSKKTKKFMSYYLPTTEKLIEKYAKLDAKNIQTENTIHIKQKIEESLDTIIKAFYELYDSLYDYDAIDITSEIDAFKNALVNDGLIDNGLKIDMPSEEEKEKVN